MSDGSYDFDHDLNFTSGTLAVDADLDNMSLKVEKLPDVAIRLKELPRIELGDFNIRVKELPKIELEANTTSTVNLAIKEIPEVRVHLPSHYNFGLTLFGVDVANFSLCGESQVITEKYIPRRMEICK
ncbi:MAG: hypothetical protein JMN24_17565 [gamma proteobacterium endosymbiont of Lamellibrachia anaximandri]|nr:hypothetical protein [gamma proteobacterium endosymbiont of Lamellibrachia anaximandri]MBL3619356.1 hypothetical protein [gamma proteobacterium endosymbiont of Lamellibrachia anaximandri]